MSAIGYINADVMLFFIYIANFTAVLLLQNITICLQLYIYVLFYIRAECAFILLCYVKTFVTLTSENEWTQTWNVHKTFNGFFFQQSVPNVRFIFCNIYQGVFSLRILRETNISTCIMDVRHLKDNPFCQIIIYNTIITVYLLRFHIFKPLLCRM